MNKTIFEEYFLGKIAGTLDLIRSTNDREVQLTHICYIHSMVESHEVRNHPAVEFGRIVYKSIEDCIDLNNPKHIICANSDIRRIAANSVRLLELAGRYVYDSALPKITDYSVRELNRIVSRIEYLYKAITEQPNMFFEKRVAEKIISIFDFDRMNHLKLAIIKSCELINKGLTYDMFILQEVDNYCNIISDCCSESGKGTVSKFFHIKEKLEMSPYKIEALIDENTSIDDIHKNTILMIEEKRSKLYENYNLTPDKNSYTVSNWGTL